MDADAAITAPEPELPPTVLTDPGNIQELPVPSAQPPSPAPSSPHMDPGISTPRPSTGDSPPSAPQSSPPEAGRQLNVTDALSYLDAVKVQFQERPEVYNQFLDIMKDFKSQSIDTPGFNTFLPVGYRIDISDPADPSIITVTTPQGITTQNTFIANNLSRSHVGTPTFPGAIPAIPVHVTGPASRPHSPHPFNLHGQLPSFDPPYSPSFQNTQTTAAASVLGNMGNNNKGPVEAQPPGEFNHAIHYLNKIKARYSDDANTYKQFLDILQTYQKEQRHLQDPAFQSQVYVQVQLLFKDAPDLLAEFKDFLPEAVAGQNQGPAILPQPVASGSVSTWVAPENNQSSSPGEKTIKKAAVPSKRKKRGAEKEPTPVPPTKPAPNREIRLACSGRDELCRSVLNDEWVSHPTWASEEAGFISHKKNSFEEALHKSEEERFEYHVHLEALARTIAVLEPLNNRIEEMTNDERTLFKLKANYGGPSKAIYHRIIKKVYGRDSGVEVIQALQDCPSVAVPVVLMRLKQKDEDWRRAQREWSRTWREVDSKNFYKSLDHQGISFKANDKKSITSKHFVTDIESIKNQQLEASQAKGVASFARGSVGYQLEYTFHDTSVLLDSLKMIYSFLDRSQANYSVAERRAIEKFLRAFIPVLCRYPVTEFNAACRPLEGGHEDDPSDLNGVDGTRSGRRSAGSSHSNQVGGVAAGDLRRKLLRTVQEKAAGKLTPSASRDPSPSPEHRTPNHSRNGDVGDSPRDIWITEVGAGSFTQSLRLGSDLEQPLFVNTTFYTLLRLLQLLYSRLFMCKEIGAKHAAEKHSSLLANRVAVELGLDEPNGPSAVLEQAMEVLDDRGANGKANVIYMYLLNACEKMFDGDMDQATFEEHMRWFFGNKVGAMLI
ncbi:hypothetical protein C0992_000678 [Termitomyces sp. T32_za158]|nr:hypothetical protein C0992_000678 [Termitomyces sp. T32_za158]